MLKFYFPIIPLTLKIRAVFAIGRMPKITIIGAGSVGSQTAFYMALKQLGDITLIDVVEGLPQGRALDILEGLPLAGSGVKVIGSNSYEESKDSEVVIVTAGLPRKPGMSRDDLIEVNARIMGQVIPQAVKYSPNCILIIVTNPLDVMVHLAYRLSGFPKEKVIGMAGALDSARFRTFLAQELKIKSNEVEAMVLGNHGDLMVPLVSCCRAKGRPIQELLSESKINSIVERVRNGGIEILTLLKSGSTFFAPALAIGKMAESILKDEKKVLPCSVLLEGEYGLKDIFVGVPVRLGRKGAEEVIELELNEEEKKAFRKSAEHIKELIKKL